MSDHIPTPTAKPTLYARGWRGLAQRLVMAFARLLLRLFVRLRVENVPDFSSCGPVVLAPNHTSLLDPTVLQVACPIHVTFMMTELFYNLRSIRWFFRLWEAIPVPEGRAAVGSIKGALTALRDGRAVAIFPEGRVSTDGFINPGRGGVGMLLARAQVPVIPVAILGTFDVLPRHRRWPRRGAVTVRFGDPIPPPADPESVDPKAFAAGVMDAIAALGAPRRPAADGVPIDSR